MLLVDSVSGLPFELDYIRVISFLDSQNSYILVKILCRFMHSSDIAKFRKIPPRACAAGFSTYIMQNLFLKWSVTFSNCSFKGFYVV